MSAPRMHSIAQSTQSQSHLQASCILRVSGNQQIMVTRNVIFEGSSSVGPTRKKITEEATMTNA